MSDLRVASYNVRFFNGTVGSAQYNAIFAHIARANPDIVFLTEVRDSLYSDLSGGAADGFGYPYFCRGKTGNYGNCCLSKIQIDAYQALSSAYINGITGNAGANEMPTSTGLLRTVHTVGEYTLIAYGVHLQTDLVLADIDNPLPAREYARWVNLYRLFQDMVNQLETYPDARVIIHGDWNEDITKTQTATISSTPAGMTAGWVSGEDLAALFPVSYATFPTRFLEDRSFMLDLAQDLNGGTGTWLWQVTDPYDLYYPFKIDYLAHSANVTVDGSEILFSDVDANTGLTKVGDPLASGLSITASDHKMIFADLTLSPAPTHGGTGQHSRAHQSRILAATL